MKTSTAGLMEIASHEGIVQMPYRDSVGVWTYGLGHTAAAGDPNPAKMAKGQATSLKMVLDTFARDVVKYEMRVNRAFKVPLKQHEFDAAVSFDYNTGGILKATWVKLFNAGNRQGAINAIMNWTKPPEIIGRRKKEQALFAKGVYSSGGFANVYPADASGRVQWFKGRRMDLRSVFDSPVSPPPPDIPAPKPEPPPPIDEPDVIDTEPTPSGGLLDSKGTSTMYAILRNVVGLLIFAGIGAFIAYKMFGINVLDLIK